MTTDQLSESCKALGVLLPVARALTTRPDVTGATAHGQPASRPPWNQAAENAVMDAHEGARRLEALLRVKVTGHPGPRRGGSDTNTAAALTAIENLSHAVTAQEAADAARFIDRLARPIQELPAVDEVEPWHTVEAKCPYCHFEMLRVRHRSMEVTCLRLGICRDNNGQHPFGRAELSVLTADPVIRWNDGLVT